MYYKLIAEDILNVQAPGQESNALHVLERIIVQIKFFLVEIHFRLITWGFIIIQYVHWLARTALS